MYDGIDAVRMGLSPGRGFANLASGVKQGLNDYARLKAFNEDRDYINQQRAKQAEDDKRRTAIRDAAAQFASSGGKNVQPLLDAYHQFYPNSANLNVQTDGKGGHVLVVTGPDGSVQKQQMSDQDLRTFGMHMTEALGDPNAYFTRQEANDEHRREFDEKMALERLRYSLMAKHGSAAINAVDRISKEFNVDWPTAYEIYSTQRENPQNALMREYDRLRATRDKQFDPSDPQRPSDDELEKTARSNVQRFYGNRITGISSRYGNGVTPDGNVDTNNMRTDAPDPNAVSSGVGPVSGLTPLPDPADGSSQDAGAPIASGQPMPSVASAPAPATTAPTDSPVPKNDLPASAAPNTTNTSALPPEALAKLKSMPGKKVRFGNGQVWTLDQGGNPVQIDPNTSAP